MDIKPIRTQADHARALKQIESLWNAQPNTRDADMLDILATLVDSYERTHFPIPAPDPISAIRFRLEQSGLATTELRRVLKTTARVSEILNRVRPLTLQMIRALNRDFAIPVDSLIEEYPLKKPRSAAKPTALRAPKKASRNKVARSREVGSRTG